MKSTPPPSLLQLLKKVDTPTVCNAIEVVDGRRGFANFTRQLPLVADPHHPPMVGVARTARIRGQQPSSEPPDKVREIRMGYYRFMYDAPKPAICVIEDLDYPDCIGAFWGEVNTYIHQAFGLQGTFTNGLMRDLDALAPDYQVMAGSIGPSHGFVHVIDFGKPANLFGITVNNGDFIHADRHGAVVVPVSHFDKLEAGIEKLIRSEKIILDAVKSGCSWKEFEKGWSDFEDSRT